MAGLRHQALMPPRNTKTGIDVNDAGRNNGQLTVRGDDHLSGDLELEDTGGGLHAMHGKDDERSAAIRRRRPAQRGRSEPERLDAAEHGATL